MRSAVRPVLTAALWCVVLAAATVAGRAQLPQPVGAINDFAGVLSDGEEESLTRLAEDVERATSAEIAVATVSSLDGMTVEEYATALFAAWGVGQAGKDNGVLILVAPSAREMRIEVGYGLEGVLPDGLAGQIIRETFVPAFRDGAFGRGIVEGTTRVAAIVRRNQPMTDTELQALAASQDGGGTTNDAMLPFVLVPFLGLFVSIGFGMAGAGLGARAISPVVFGGFFGGIPVVIGASVGMPSGGWILAGIAVLALVIGYRLGRRPEGRAAMRGSSKKSGDRWVWGTGGSSSGRSGSSGSSGSSRSSSSSFGGGRSGGGGASGRW